MMALKNKKGAALTWAIVLGLVVFALLGLLLSVLFSSGIGVKSFQNTIQRRTDLEQLGEYYIRCCGMSGSFPTGEETNYDTYTWMDAETVDFFEHIKDEYDYRYTSELKTELNGLLNFYTDKAYVRKLTVKTNSSNGDKEIMTLIVEEYMDYDTENFFILTFSNNGSSAFRVIDWSIVDIDEEFTTESLGLLGNIWKAIGGGISKIVVKTTESDKWKITYDKAGGSTTVEPITAPDKGTSFVLPEATKEGCRFDGWVSDGNTFAAGSVISPTKNMNFVASWTSYTVYFDANGGTPTPDSARGVVESLPTITNPGAKIFAGWKDEATGQVYSGGSRFVPTADTRLIAEWTNAKTYAVTYDKGTATSGTVPASQVKIEGRALTLQTNSGNLAKSSTTANTASFTVNYNSNGGSSTPSSQTVNASKTTSYTFNGWMVKGGSTTYSAGGQYTTDAALTLVPNFSSSVSSSGAQVTLGNPGTKTNYSFLGWYNGSTYVGKAGDKYSPSGSSTTITLTAKWQIITYTVTFSASNGSVRESDVALSSLTVPSGTTVSKNGASLTFTPPSGETISGKSSVTVSASPGNNYDFDSWSGVPTSVTSSCTITASFKSSSCVAAGTLITMADGTQKAVETLAIGDVIQTFDFSTGKLSSKPILTMEVLTDRDSRHINVSLDNGKCIEVIEYQAFFDATKREYFVITPENAESYIGTKLLTEDGTATITAVNVFAEFGNTYEIITYDHYNFYANGVLTCEPFFFCTNLFAIDENYRYDEELMAEDIAKYGLYTYDDLKDIMTEEEFYWCNGQFLKIAIGKGKYTMEQVKMAVMIYESRYKPCQE